MYDFHSHVVDLPKVCAVLLSFLSQTTRASKTKLLNTACHRCVSHVTLIDSDHAWFGTPRRCRDKSLRRQNAVTFARACVLNSFWSYKTYHCSCCFPSFLSNNKNKNDWLSSPVPNRACVTCRATEGVQRVAGRQPARPIQFRHVFGFGVVGRLGLI